MRISDTEKAYKVLNSYKGENNFIKYIQYKTLNGSYVMSEFEIQYILENKNFKSYQINKTVSITNELGNKLNEKFQIGFIPQKIRISTVIGEMGNSLHCYIQYRQSIPPTLAFINKNSIISPLSTIDIKDVVVDFDYYDSIAKDGRKIKELQKEGIKFLLANKKCILAYGMGFGKTNMAIVAAMASKSTKILIITTASLKTNWKRELMLYNDEGEIQILKGSKDEIQGDKKYLITNYDILANYYDVPTEKVYETIYELDEHGNRIARQQIVKVKNSQGKLVAKEKKSTKKAVIEKSLKNSPLFLNNFDCVIIDEAQSLSNNKSIRYKVVDDFLKRAKPNYVFLLSGTPLTNKPINLYYILKLIDAPISKDYMYYAKRYCDAKTFRLKTGKDVTVANGASNLDELREKIKHLYIRRVLSEMGDMVDKQVLTKYYDLTEEQMVTYNKLWSEYVEAQQEQGKEDSEQYRQLVEGILVRQFLAKEMTSHTIELVDNMLEEGGKVIIACTFTEEINIFKQHYKDKCVVYDGKMDAAKKDKAEQEFNNNPRVRIFVGQIVAAGVGLNLVTANKMVFNSYSWVAAQNKQMEDRIYRLTQKKDVMCVYQLFNDSISQHMYETVINKQHMADTIIRSEMNK